MHMIEYQISTNYKRHRGTNAIQIASSLSLCETWLLTFPNLYTTQEAKTDHSNCKEGGENHVSWDEEMLESRSITM